MSFKLGLVAIPIFIITMLRKNKSASGRFIAAGAVSPQTARRPDSVGVSPTLGLIQSAVKARVLVPLGDGRFYADVRRHRIRQTLLALAFACLVGAFAIGAAWVVDHRPE